ncbi:pentapeptide repeat-containing protein [Streptomyces sp. NPDC094034]|uniref:pentapeptide repeat-containing protein n=1 Tax=Streptomyces sp. NPDC094034 TaxID=3155309 RepID=UPI003324F48C
MITSDAPALVKEATDEPTAATRHLCAGVYVDERFRDLVINEVCAAPHRRVAPSYGFDIVPVMHHAWLAAALSALLRATVMGAAIFPVLAGALPAAILVTCGLALLWLLHAAALLRDVETEPRYKRKSKRRGLGTARRKIRLLTLIFTWKYSGRIKYSEKISAFKKIGVVALNLVLVGLSVAVLFPVHAISALYSAGTIAVSCLAVGAARQVMLNRILRATDLRPKRLSRRQRVADTQQRHVCAVYRRPRHNEDDDLTVFTLFGDESPFIGAGELVYQWNPPICIQLLRPGDDDEAPLHEREHPVPPFQAHELVEHIRDAVQQLNADDGEVRLPVQVRDRVYVAETDVAADRTLLPSRINENDMRAIINTPGSKSHHFLEITMPLEGGEFVATVMLNVSLQGRTLSISTAACVLAHSPRSFQHAEEFGQNGAAAVALTAIRQLSTLPGEISRSWRIIRYFYALGKAVLLPSDLTSTPIRNVLVGTRISAREKAAQSWSKIQLEKSGILGRMKTIEQRLLHAASDFLRAKNVDISEFNDRALKIINSGIFNFGDNNTFSNNAVGDGSKAGGTGNQSAGSGNQGNGERK